MVRLQLVDQALSELWSAHNYLPANPIDGPAIKEKAREHPESGNRRDPSTHGSQPTALALLIQHANTVAAHRSSGQHVP